MFMATKVIYFLIGVSVATILNINYFSKIINEQNELIASDFQSNMSFYKASFSDQALPVIKSNNIAIRGIMESEPDELNTHLARTLLISTMLLNAMTLQDLDVKKEVFLSAMLFYKKSSNKQELDDIIPLLIESCKSNNIFPECTKEKINALLVFIK
jgi:hypothetical protein